MSRPNCLVWVAGRFYRCPSQVAVEARATADPHQYPVYRCETTGQLVREHEILVVSTGGRKCPRCGCISLPPDADDAIVEL